MEKPHRKTFEG